MQQWLDHFVNDMSNEALFIFVSSNDFWMKAERMFRNQRRPATDESRRRIHGDKPGAKGRPGPKETRRPADED